MQYFSEMLDNFQKNLKIAKFDEIFINFLKILNFSAEKLLSVDYIWTVLYTDTAVRRAEAPLLP